MHQVEVQNEIGKVMWRGQISIDRKGFDTLLEKIRTIERSNSDMVKGIFMNPTGNYHMPLCTVYLKMRQNTKRIKRYFPPLHLLFFS